MCVRGGRSEHSPDVGKERIVVVRVSPHTVDICGGPVKFVPVRILQADTEIQPWPERRATVAEWQIGKLEDVAGAVRAPGEGAVKCRIRGASNRDPPGGKTPRTVVDIRNRGIQRSQLVVGIVGEPERLASARIMILVDPGDASSDSMQITEILVLSVNADIRKGIGAPPDSRIGKTFDASPNRPDPLNAF